MRTLTAILCAAFMMPCSVIYAQFSVNTVVNYLAANACGNEVTNQYLMMKIGGLSHNFNTAPPQITSHCPTGIVLGNVTTYGGNANYVDQLNQIMGDCQGKTLFYDLMGSTYNGIAPANSKVLLFPGANPDIAAIANGVQSTQCGLGPIFVAFGNYTGTTPFFSNSQTSNGSCGNYQWVDIVVNGILQRIQYDPDRLQPYDGAFVKIESDGTVWYSMAGACISPLIVCPDPPTVNFSGDLSICEGERAIITADAGPGHVYRWSNGVVGPTIDVAPKINTAYYVTVTNLTQPQCSFAAKTSVEVFTFPMVEARVLGPGPYNEICYGDPAELLWRFTTGNPTNFSYQWIPPDPAIPINNDIIDPLDETSAGPYQLVIQFSGGCILEKTIEVTYPAPLPITICHNAPVCQGAPVSLEAAAADADFVWTGPDGFSANGPSHVLLHPAPGTYTATATSPEGCTSSASTEIVVNPCMPETTGVGDFVWNDSNGDGIQNVDEYGVADVLIYLLYDINQDGIIDYGEATDSTYSDVNGWYSFIDLLPNVPYQLRFEISDAYWFILPYQGSDSSKDSDVEPEGGLTDTFSLQQDIFKSDIDAGLICALSNQTVDLRVTNPCYGSSNGTILVIAEYGMQPIVFNWSDIGPESTGYRDSLAAGTYTVTVSDGGGCSLVKTIVLVEPAAPLEATAQTTAPDCSTNSGGAIDVTVTGGMPGYVYNWEDITSLPEPEDRIDLPMGYYYLTVTDTSGCTVELVVDLTNCVNSLTAHNKKLQSEAGPINDRTTEQTHWISKVKLLPNPAKDVFSVLLPEDAGLCQIDVFDELSRLVYTVKGRDRVQVQVTNWASGSYLVRVQSLLDESVHPVLLKLIVRE